MIRDALPGMVACVLVASAPASAAGQWLDYPVPEPPAVDSTGLVAGEEIYQRRCWFCHGEEGRGDGPVARYLWPRPRDFFNAVYRLRTTGSGALPLDEDLYRTISLGVPGTAMPAWETILTPEERWQVVAYVKAFASDLFEDEAFDPYRAIVEVGSPPEAPTEGAAAKEGLDAYVDAECDACHGLEGRGYGQRADSITDDLGRPILPTDLRTPWKYKGGSGVEEIYLRLSTGLDGTPMPSYSSTLTGEERWRIAQYVASLQDGPGEDPAGGAVIPARFVEEGVPSRPGHPLWGSAVPISIPLTGQATFPPRWQIPSVTDVEVRALHDGRRLVLRLSWTDPLPDTVPADTAQARRVGWEADDTWPALDPDQRRVRRRFPDAAEVVIPARYDGGVILPHFVYGAPERPVELWRWRGDLSRSRAGLGGIGDGVHGEPSLLRLRGAGVEEPPRIASGEGDAVARAAWREGRWSVVLRWTLEDGGLAGGRGAGGGWRLTPGRQIPVAFHLRDGANGETGLRMALSSWYYLYLEEEGGAGRYLAVLLAVLGVGTVEWATVWWMRRRAEAGVFIRFGVRPGGDRASPAT